MSKSLHYALTVNPVNDRVCHFPPQAGIVIQMEAAAHGRTHG
ncbi:MAG: hypothetical protein WBE92_18415 [Steroidobacteraceae bacterium]